MVVRVSTLFLCSLALLAAPLMAALSLEEQINAVSAVQERNERATQEAEQAKRREEERQRQDAERRAEKHWAMQQARERQRAAQMAGEKKREQAYDDQLRALDLQQKLLLVQAEKTRVNRENDYIDQELKERSARTDVIQSNADATRALASGTKILMEKEGEADVKKESGLFH